MASMDESQEDANAIDFFPQSFVTKIFVSVLEEALDQLLILKTISNWPEVDQIDVTYKTIEERFSESAPKTIQRTTDDVLYFKHKCAHILEIVKTTVEELKKSGSYDQLLNIINVFKTMKSDEEKLKEDTSRKRAELRNLERVLEGDTQYYHRKIEECMANIGRIKDEIEDFKIQSEIKLNYVRKWQNSKMEMTETLLSRNEQQKTDKIRKLDADVYKEARVHHEILAAYQEMQKDLECEIDSWKEKYDNHLKELDEKISRLNKEREKQQQATIKLKEKYSSRQKQIDSYKEYKVKQEEIRADLEKRNKAATKIQAWWRGTMVRKGFGKFRKKKDKKAKKKSAEQPKPKT